MRPLYSPGQGVNSQFGPDLPTALPLGQSFASMAHAIGCVEPDWTTISGQGVNSQFGPDLPTALPSEQSLASMSHSWVGRISGVDHVSPGHGANSQFGHDLPTALPSGQSLASSVHAWAFISGLIQHPAKTILNKNNGKISFFMYGEKKIKPDWLGYRDRRKDMKGFLVTNHTRVQ